MKKILALTAFVLSFASIYSSHDSNNGNLPDIESLTPEQIQELKKKLINFLNSIKPTSSGPSKNMEAVAFTQRISILQLIEYQILSEYSDLTSYSQEQIYGPMVAQKQQGESSTFSANLISGYQHTNYDAHANTKAQNNNSVGAMILSDVRLSKSIFFGQQLGYMHKRTDAIDQSSYTSSDSVSGGLFGMFVYEKLFALLLTSFDWSYIKTFKNLTKITEPLIGYPNAYSISASATAGYSFHLKDILLTPILGLSYIRDHVYSFEQKAGRILRLQYDTLNINGLESLVGFRFSWKKGINKTILLLNLEADWQYQLFNQSQTAQATFVRLALPIPINLVQYNRNLFLATANFATLFSKTSIQVSYNTQYSPNNMYTNSVVGFVGYAF